MPNIVYYNIALRETVGRELRRTRAQAEAYTSATGFSKVTPYVGRWDEVVALMEQENINIEYLYSFVLTNHNTAKILMRVNDTDRAVKILEQKGIKLLSEKIL